MGYACPVCEEPQADGEHLANHLAFSALLGRAAHADWLDEHAPGWDDEGPAELAERVTPHAEAVELPSVTDDELPEPPAGAGPQGAAGLEDALARGGGAGRERLDAETRRVIEEARALTPDRDADGVDADGADGDAEGADDDGDGPGGDGSADDSTDGERAGDPAADDNGK